MKGITSPQAAESARKMPAREFDKAFSGQIEVLDQDNILDPNEGDYNIIFHGSDGKSLSVSFYSGVLEQVYEMEEA